VAKTGKAYKKAHPLVAKKVSLRLVAADGFEPSTFGL
jgi:hypothetical protein